MTKHSPRHKWQTRWRIDPGARTAAHDTGLIVAYDCAMHALERPRGQARNGPDIVAALTPKHGAGNAPIMLRRLIDEADRLFSKECHDARINRGA